MNYQVKFDEITWNVHLHDSKLLNFLKSYFTPFFSWEEGWTDDPFCTLHIEISDKDWVSGDEGDQEFLIDGSKGFLSMTGRVISMGELRVFRLYPMDVIVEMDVSKKRIKVIGFEPKRLMVPVLRIIEDITLIELERRGSVVLHASGVTVEGNAVLVLGDKGAGKTSSLCYLLNQFRCAKLTNDNAVLRIKDGEVLARGWPSFFKVEPGTVASFTELAPYYPKNRINKLQSSQELWCDKEKIALYPEQGAHVFGKIVIPSAKLKTFIFPRFTTENVFVQKWRDDEELLQRLTHNLQGSFNDKHPNWHGFNEVSEDYILHSLKQMVEILTIQADCYSLQWAPALNQLLSEIEILRRVNESILACEAIAYDSRWPEPPKVFFRETQGVSE